MIDIGTLYGRLVLEDEYSVALHKLGSQLDKIGGTFQRAGTVLTASITAPLAGMAAAAISAGTTFEKEMNAIQGVLTPTASQMEQVRARAIEMGAATAFSATEAAQAMLELGKTGFSVQESIEATDEVMQLAAASGFSMGEAAAMAGRTMNAFGLEVEDLAHVNDILAAGVNRSSLELDDLRLGFQYVGPVARGLNLSLEDVTAALAIMRDGGVKAESAGRALAGGFVNLLDPTKKAGEALREVGLSAEDFKTAEGRLIPLSEVIQKLGPHAQNTALMMRVFGKESGPDMAALLQPGIQGWEKMRNEMNNVEGAAKKMADAMMQGLPGAIEKMRGAVETALIAVSKAIEKPVIAIVNALASVAEFIADKVVPAFTALPDSVQTAILVFAGLAAAIGPLVFVAGTFLSAWGSLVAVFPAVSVAATAAGTAIAGLALPITATIAVVGALVAAWYKWGDDITAVVSDTYNEIKDWLVDKFEGSILQSIVNLLGAIDDAWQNLRSNVIGWMGDILEAGRKNFITEWNRVFNSAKSALDKLDKAAADSQLSKWMHDVVNQAKTNFMTEWNRVFDSIKEKIDWLTGWFKQFGTNVQTSVAPATLEFKNLGTNFGALAAPASAASSAINNVGAAATNANAANADFRAQLAAVEKEFRTLEPATKAQIAAGLELGVSTGEIAEKLGLAEATVKLYGEQLEAAEKKTKATAEAKKKFQESIEELNNKTLPPYILLLRDVNTEVGETEFWGRSLTRVVAEQGRAVGVVTSLWVPFRDTVKQVKPNLEGLEKPSKNVTVNFRELAASISNLAEITGSDALGKVGEFIGILGVGEEAAKTMKSGLDNLSSGGVGGIVAGMTQMVSAIGTGIAAIEQMAESGNTAMTVLSGVSTGAQIGSAFGGVGALFGAAIGGIYGWVAAAREQAEAIRQVTLAIPKMVDEINKLTGAAGSAEATARALGISVEGAFGPNAGGVVARAEALERVFREMKERIKEVNDNFRPLLQQFDTFGRQLPDDIQFALEGLRDLGILTGDNLTLFETFANKSRVNWRDMQDLAEKYGISLEGLGDQFEHAKVQDTAKEIWNAFDSLIDQGADTGAVLVGMKDEIVALARQALEFGTTIPSNFKPLIDNLMQSNQLTDEQRSLFEQLEDVDFGPSIVSEFDGVIEAIRDLIAELRNGLGNELKNNLPYYSRSASDALVGDARHAEDAWRSLGDTIANEVIQEQSPTGLEGVIRYARYAGDALENAAYRGMAAMRSLGHEIASSARLSNDLGLGIGRISNSSIGKALTGMMSRSRDFAMDSSQSWVDAAQNLGATDIFSKIQNLGRTVMLGGSQGFSKELMDLQFQMFDEAEGLGPNPDVYRKSWGMATSELTRQLGWQIEDIHEARQAQLAELGELPEDYASIYAKATAKAQRELDKRVQSVQASFERELAEVDKLRDVMGDQYGTIRAQVIQDYEWMKEEALERYQQEIDRIGPLPDEYARIYAEATNQVNAYYDKMEKRAHDMHNSAIASLGPVPDEYEAAYGKALELVKHKYAQMATAAAESAKMTIDAWKWVEESFKKMFPSGSPNPNFPGTGPLPGGPGGSPNLPQPGPTSGDLITVEDAYAQVRNLWDRAGRVPTAAEEAQLAAAIGFQQGMTRVPRSMVEQAMNLVGKYLGLPGYATGTMGVTGSWFQDFGSGSLAMLHGKEAIVTPGQADEFARQHGDDELGGKMDVLIGLLGELPDRMYKLARDGALQSSREL